MKKTTIYLAIQYLSALVWLANGLFCKILNLVPRHQQIVGRILGTEHAEILTQLIGASEIIMAIWILSKFKTKLNVAVQICVIMLMNIIEFLLAPDLLLWSRFNLLFAVLFVALLYYNEFIFKLKNEKYV